MNTREIFRKNLNELFSSSGKMQKDLAEYCGAKTTTVSGWTRGISYPRADSMEMIARFFGVPTSRLVGPSDSNDDHYSDINSNHLDFSPEERQLIEAWRHADEGIRTSIRKLLDLPVCKKDIESSAI